VIDVFTGFKLRETHDFQKEVCFLGYSDEYNLLVSISWDKQIRIYKDFNELDKKPDKDCNILIQSKEKKCH
jgi:WD40 repeat protein